MKITPQKINLFVLILAIIIRGFSEYLIADLPTDKTFQITSATHLADLKGISLAHADSSDLAKTVYERIGLWPPGYALLVAPLLATGLDWFSAALIIDILAVCLFFISWHLIFYSIREHIPPYFPSVVFLYWAFAISPFRHLYSTDLIALSFCSLGFLGLIKAMKYLEKLSFPYILLTSFTFFSSSLFHYGFYSVSISFPLILILFAYIKNKSLIKPAFYSLIGTVVFIILQMAYLKFYVGDAYYLNEYHPNPLENFHFYNLKKFDPFVVNSFFDSHLVNRYLGSFQSSVFTIVFSLLIFFILALSFARELFYNKIRDWTIKHWFYLSGLIIVVMKILLLVVLSLRYPPEYNGWSYVGEPRYFSVAFLFLPLFLIFFTMNRKEKWQRINAVFCNLIIGLAIVFSSIVNIFLLKKYSLYTPIANTCKYYHYSKELYSFIEESVFIKQKETIVFCNAQDNYINELFLMEGLKTIDFNQLPTEIKTSRDIKILIALDDNSRKEASLFLKNHKSRKLLSLKDLNAEIWEVSIQKNIQK